MKETIEKYELLDEMLIGLFEQDKGIIAAHDIADLEALLEESFKYYLKPAQADRDIEEMFQCDVHNFNTDIVSMLNGWHFSKNGALHTYPNGVVMGSFSAAMKAYPELFEKYYGEIADNTVNGFVSINTALAQDGVKTASST